MSYTKSDPTLSCMYHNRGNCTSVALTTA